MYPYEVLDQTVADIREVIGVGTGPLPGELVTILREREGRRKTLEAMLDDGRIILSSSLEELFRAVDALLSLDWEDSVGITCPEDVDAAGILNRLQDARDKVDARGLYKSAPTAGEG